MKDIEVISEIKMRKASSPGIERHVGFDRGEMFLSRSTIASGNVSVWHHHGTRDLFGYVVSGALTIEYGPKGESSVVLSEGEFFNIPTGMVHRDVNKRPDTAVVVSVLVGSGTNVVEVLGPA